MPQLKKKKKRMEIICEGKIKWNLPCCFLSCSSMILLCSVILKPSFGFLKSRNDPKISKEKIRKMKNIVNDGNRNEIPWIADDFAK